MSGDKPVQWDGRMWDTPGERGNLLAGEGWRYTRRGRVRHQFADWISLCGLDLDEEEWRGTGSQAEYERLTALPKCGKCMALGAS